MKQTLPVKEGTTALITVTLVDATGAPIQLTSISTATLTLWNGEMAEGGSNVINSRTAQNVKNANNCTIHATSGLFTWTVQAADATVIDAVRALGDTELHLFRLTVTHSASGSPFSELYGMRVERVQP